MRFTKGSEYQDKVIQEKTIIEEMKRKLTDKFW